MRFPEEINGSGRMETWLNRLLRACIESRVVESPQIRPVQCSHGVVLEITQAPSPPGTPGVGRQFLVKEVLDNHLRCVEFENGSQGSQQMIAKPFDLRKAGWDGVTVTYMLYPSGSISISYTYLSPFYRTALNQVGSAVTTEAQVIIPYYVPDKSVIYAIQPDNGTGVALANEWIDVNADGRAWARTI